jgi:exoribonuclease R
MNTIPIRNVDLQAMATQAMLENGFEPEFPLQVQQQLDELKAHPPQIAPSANIRDLRNLLWSSIDNDTSRYLDQIEVAERMPNGETKILVGIADVDIFVPKKPRDFLFPLTSNATRETCDRLPVSCQTEPSRSCF